MNIPKVNISDLIAATQTANPSASVTPVPAGTPSANPIGDFINTLAKYAKPVSDAVQNIPQEMLKSQQTGENLAYKAATNNPILPIKPKSVAGEILNPQGNLADIPSDLAQTIKTEGENMKNNPQAVVMGSVLNTGGGKISEEGLPKIENITEKAQKVAPEVEKPTMITKNKADPKAIAQMGLNFDVPRRIAQNMQVKPETVMNQLIDDKISGRNLDDLQSVVDNVTGENGAFPRINNYILGKIKDPISFEDAVKSKDLNLQSVLEGEKPGFINEINKEVGQAFQPVNYNQPGELPSDIPAGHAYATDLFQVSQNLRTLQRMYMRKAYTDMGELNHPEMERAANAIGEIKNNVDDAIDKNVPADVYNSFKSDPYIQQQLSRMPQTIADRWLQGASRFKDGQSIQAPYVNLGSMIEDTKDTQLSVWTKAAKAMQEQNTSGGAGQLIKENVPGPKIVKNIAGGVTKMVMKPFDKKPEDIFEENMNAAGSAKPKSKIPGGKGTKIIAGLGLAGALGAGLEHINNASNAQSQSHTDNSDNSHTDKITTSPLSVNSQIETNVSKIDPSIPALDPREVTGSDGNSLAMSDGKYQTAIAALDALTKQDPSYITNPIKAGQLKAAKDAIDAKYAASQKLMTSYQKVSTAQQKIEDAQALLKKTNIKLTDKNSMLEGVHEMLDPNYQALVNDLNFIENSDPRLKGQLSNLATRQSIDTALKKAGQLLLSEHNQLLKSYGAGSQTPAGNTTQVTQTTPVSQIPAGLPAPINGSLPPMDNGSYQFTPPNPMFQQ